MIQRRTHRWVEIRLWGRVWFLHEPDVEKLIEFLDSTETGFMLNPELKLKRVCDIRVGATQAPAKVKEYAGEQRNFEGHWPK